LNIEIEEIRQGAFSLLGLGLDNTGPNRSFGLFMFIGRAVAFDNVLRVHG
jgi:hypothetical protein